MSFPSGALSTLRHVPRFPHFSVAALLLGTAASFAMPYLPLFGRNEAHMSPLALGVFMTLMSLGELWQVIGFKEAEGLWEGRRPEVQAACHTASCHVLKATCC